MGVTGVASQQRPEEAELLPAHTEVNPPRVSPRFETISRRLAFIEGLWNDRRAFDRLVEDGRYMQLARVTCQAQEAFESNVRVVVSQAARN